jgi:DNA-binding NarL/FixJ family response regulator
MHLTPRHKQVLLLIAEGLSDKEISKKLKIAHATVGAHKHQIRNVTGARTPVALYRWAQENKKELSA